MTLLTLTFPPNQSINMPRWVGIGKLEKGVLPPQSRGGGGCAGGSDAAAAAASMAKEAAAVDWTVVVCVGSGGRPRWLMILVSMA